MSERDYIILCKSLIMDRYPLGVENGQWRQRDIEALAQLIEEKSGIKLSISTLKRIWRTDFNQTPHPSTLDAMVSVLDYKDWLEFKNDHQEGRNHTVIKEKSKMGSWLTWIMIAIAFVFVGFLVIGPGFGAQSTRVNVQPFASGPVTFSSIKSIETGVPNTIIFNYDVRNIQADSFFIQQSWNETHRIMVDPTATSFSSTYYTPGFHRAKLLANDSIFKISKIHIQTDGWLALARYNQNDLVPVYLRDPTIGKGGEMKVTTEQLSKAGVDLDRNFTLNYHNVREFNELPSDNFQLRTRIKADSIGNYACPFLSVTILCEEHIFYVPLTSLGCVGNVDVKFGEVIHSGLNSDLRNFGRDIYQWQDLFIKVKNKHAQVFLVDELIYESSYSEDFGNIKGLVLRFSGGGSVDFVKLMDREGNPVLEDSFL